MPPNLPTLPTDAGIPPRGPMQMDAAADPQPAMDESEVCIPIKALAQPDDQDQVQTPGEGDTVNFTVDGVINRVEGDKAYVKPMSINGTALESSVSDKEPTPEDSGPSGEESDLRSMALQQ